MSDKDNITLPREVAEQALEALKNNKRTHYFCEDNWYSCPKHEEGCANEMEGDDCNCGADEANVQIESAITALRTALAAPAQKPDALALAERLASGRLAIIEQLTDEVETLRRDAERWKHHRSELAASLGMPRELVDAIIDAAMGEKT